jgi:hypothetical protein
VPAAADGGMLVKHDETLAWATNLFLFFHPILGPIAFAYSAFSVDGRPSLSIDRRRHDGAFASCWPQYRSRLSRTELEHFPF